MKDLIKEIEGLKLKTHPEETEYRFGFRDGNNTCVVSVKNILTQHNIITAPKSIKLSEVVNKLRNAFVGLGNIDYKGFIEIGYGFITLDDEKVITIDLDSQKIVLIEFCNTFIDFKWLYTLWIVGTEIIDDLEEENNEM